MGRPFLFVRTGAYHRALTWLAMTTEDLNQLQSASPTDTEQAQTPAPDSTESGTEQTAQETEPPQEAPKPKTDWAQRRIDQLTREKYEERRQREALATQLAQYQQPADQQQSEPQDIDKLVEQRASEKLAAKTFNDACNRVFEAGVKENPDFERNLRTLQSVGEIGRDFLELVTEMDDGHRVLSHLGANPEEAEQILSLPPLKQARALAKLEVSLSKATPAPPVSKAPAPISPVGSKAAPVAPESFATTADYIAWRKQNRK